MGEAGGIIGALLWVLSWVAGGGQGGGVVLTRSTLGQPEAAAGQSQAASPAPAAGQRSAEQAADLIIEARGELKGDELKEAERAVEAAEASQPANWKFKTALAVVLSGRREHERAIRLADEAVRLEPAAARAWYWRGQTKFNQLSETRSLDALGEIDDAKASMEKAIALDGTYAAPHMSLAMFYIEAPGIVGGSIRKARERGNALLALPDPGPSLGRVVLARCAVYKEDWDEAKRQYDAMEQAAATPEAKCAAIVGWARVQITDQGKYADGLNTLERGAALAATDTQRAGIWYLRGEAKRKLRDIAGAVESYRKVLELSPDAQRSRLALAECLEQTRSYAAAAEQYQEYARRFPKDDKARDAAKKAERLRKKAG
jgi:tetratricopeptide (TPR) repeat protein